jgi:serine/threonine-protein kinase HipA
MDQEVLDFYAELPQQGPGSDADSDAALNAIIDRLPPAPTVADLGCGTGRSALFLAERLRTRVVAVDIASVFCKRLARDAAEGGLSSLVDVRQGDMSDPPIEGGSLDLLWSEGAAYIIGFKHALKRWRTLLRPTGFCVVSECCWLSDDRPEPVARYFAAGYPEMTSVAGSVRRATDAGYELIATHKVTAEAWERYYRPIRRALREGAADHLDLAFARELRDEMRMFGQARGSFGYVFFVLKPAP